MTPRLVDRQVGLVNMKLLQVLSLFGLMMFVASLPEAPTLTEAIVPEGTGSKSGDAVAVLLSLGTPNLTQSTVKHSTHPV